MRLTQTKLKKLINYNLGKIYHTENFLTNGAVVLKSENLPFMPKEDNIRHVLPAKTQATIEKATNQMSDSVATWFSNIKNNSLLKLYKSNIYYTYKDYEACIFFSDGFTNFAIINKLYVDVLHINIILYINNDFEHNPFVKGPFLTEYGEELVMGMDKPDNDPFLREILHAVMKKNLLTGKEALCY